MAAGARIQGFQSLPFGTDGKALSGEGSVIDRREDRPQTGSDTKTRGGGYFDRGTGIYLEPPADGAYDPNTGTYAAPENFGSVDPATGNYIAPAGMTLDATNGLVATPGTGTPQQTAQPQIAGQRPVATDSAVTTGTANFISGAATNTRPTASTESAVCVRCIDDTIALSPAAPETPSTATTVVSFHWFSVKKAPVP